MIAEAKPEIALPLLNSDQTSTDFYTNYLRPLLETTHSGQYVAIHADTHDYLVERRPGKALREMQAKHPKGNITVHRIGPADSAYQARLRGEWPR